MVAKRTAGSVAPPMDLPAPTIPQPVSAGAELARRADDIAITDEASLETGTDALAMLNRALTEAETARKALVKPLQEHVAFINSTFKEQTDALRAGIGLIKQRIATYHTEAEKAEQEAVREAAKLVGAGTEVQEIAASVERPRTTHATQGGAQIKKRWDYEVIDWRLLATHAAATGDPLVEADKGALRRHVNAGVREIPGVRIFEVTDVSVV